MAGDWIKVRCDLIDDPAVIGIAAALSMDEFAVVGRLVRLWSWANLQTSDGNAKVTLAALQKHDTSVTETWIDRYLCAPGFARALVAHGWLLLSEDGLTIPKFEKHNGKSAKQRALTSNRVSKRRTNLPRFCNAASVTEALPEKRREEKIEEKTPHSPPEGVDAPHRTPASTASKKTPTTPPEDFLRFWAVYPRKVSRPAALRSWLRLKPDAALLEVILAALEKQKMSNQWTRDGGQYIPHPSTWLNNRRWEDDTATQTSPPQTNGTRRESPEDILKRIQENQPWRKNGSTSGACGTPTSSASPTLTDSP